MSQSFANTKGLKFVITLGSGNFGSGSNNQITLEGFRAVVNIDKAGGMIMGTLHAQIYGVSQSDMNSCVAFPFQPQRITPNGLIILNTIQVFAIDGAQETLVFTGNIVNAWGNYDAMPDVFLQIQAQSAFAAQITPSAPSSYSGHIDVAFAMQQLASTMGLSFENNGVTVQLSNQYLPNSPLEKARTLAQAAGIWMYIDNGVLAITPANQPRKSAGNAPLISASTGLKGYPTFDSVGVNFTCLFNPAIIHGALVQLDTIIPQAAGEWIATALALDLSSEKPDGKWFMRVNGTKSGFALVSA